MNKNLNRFQRAMIKGIGVDKFIQNYTATNTITSLGKRSVEDYKQEEYKVWFDGSAEGIEEFYKYVQHPYRVRTHGFWAAVNTDMVRVHSGLPSAISNAFGSLLFSKTPEIKVDARSVTRARKLQDRLNMILDENDILSLMQEAAQMQSYSGAVAFKLNYDPSLVDVPLMTLYPKERFYEHKKLGQTVYIDFYDYYHSGNDTYKLISRYGRGHISYSLFLGDKEVPLNSVAQTSGLRDIAFCTQGFMIPNIFAEVIQNKSGSRSDYEGLISLFNALDETYSTMIDYIRRSKINTFMTEDLLPKDARGKAIPRSQFDNTITILDKVQAATDVPGVTESRIERDIHNAVTKGYQDTIGQLVEQILAKVSLSPATLGIAVGGARESSEALKIRERASMRIRSEKLSIWEEKFASLLDTAVLMDHIMVNSIGDEFIYEVEKIPEYLVFINFPEHDELDKKEKSELYMGEYKAGLISVDFALTRMYGDELTREGLMHLIVTTKIEKGIPLTPEQELYVEEQEKIKKEANRNSVLDL